jgi:hypothetical protein
MRNLPTSDVDKYHRSFSSQVRVSCFAGKYRAHGCVVVYFFCCAGLGATLADISSLFFLYSCSRNTGKSIGMAPIFSWSRRPSLLQRQEAYRQPEPHFHFPFRRQHRQSHLNLINTTPSTARSGCNSEPNFVFSSRITSQFIRKLVRHDAIGSGHSTGYCNKCNSSRKVSWYTPLT